MDEPRQPDAGADSAPDSAPDAASESTGDSVAASRALEDPVYAEAVVDLLGAIAYGEISAFERLAKDARMAPELGDKGELAKMAAAEYSHYERLCEHLVFLGADPIKAMAPFRKAFDDFHDRTASSDWLEGVVPEQGGGGLGGELSRELPAIL